MSSHHGSRSWWNGSQTPSINTQFLCWWPCPKTSLRYQSPSKVSFYGIFLMFHFVIPLDLCEFPLLFSPSSVFRCQSGSQVSNVRNFFFLAFYGVVLRCSDTSFNTLYERRKLFWAFRECWELHTNLPISKLIKKGITSGPSTPLLNWDSKRNIQTSAPDWAMKVRVVHRDPEEYDPSCGNSVHRMLRNADPSLHPLEKVWWGTLYWSSYLFSGSWIATSACGYKDGKDVLETLDWCSGRPSGFCSLYGSLPSSFTWSLYWELRWRNSSLEYCKANMY